LSAVKRCAGTLAGCDVADGFQAAFVGGAGVALVGVLVALVIVRRRDLARPAAEPALALEAA
jgi:hypothetical protein